MTHHGFARRIRPSHGWNDLTLPGAAVAQLRAVAAEAAETRSALDSRGRGRSPKGVALLFTGPAGSGKTLAAEALAGELNLDLYRIDLNAVVSDYIGETEKNLEAVFSDAEDGGAILFFDEADALFGKRSEVKDAHDRYANVEVSYLLGRAEEYPGIVILATNLRQNIDPAFIRRMRLVIEFEQ